MASYLQWSANKRARREKSYELSNDEKTKFHDICQSFAVQTIQNLTIEQATYATSIKRFLDWSTVKQGLVTAAVECITSETENHHNPWNDMRGVLLRISSDPTELAHKLTQRLHQKYGKEDNSVAVIAALSS